MPVYSQPDRDSIASTDMGTYFGVTDTSPYLVLSVEGSTDGGGEPPAPEGPFGPGFGPGFGGGGGS